MPLKRCLLTEIAQSLSIFLGCKTDWFLSCISSSKKMYFDFDVTDFDMLILSGLADFQCAGRYYHIAITTDSVACDN